MAQHFRLSATARQLSVDSLASLSDAEIFQLLKQARWGNADEMNHVICPHCHAYHQPISFLLVNNGSANIVSIVFLLQQARFFKVQNFLCVKLYWLFSILLPKVKAYPPLRYHINSMYNTKLHGCCYINFVNPLIKPKI